MKQNRAYLGRKLGPVLYTLYTVDLQTMDQAKVVTYADDTAILSTYFNLVTASVKLQLHLFEVEKWLKIRQI